VALKTDVADDYVTLIASLGHLGRNSGIREAIKTFNELSVAAGSTPLPSRCLEHGGGTATCSTTIRRTATG
jgi:hypothetical protein